MGIKVCKFGGSSVADADQIAKVRSIVHADRDRRFIVVSAPGKRCDEDRKITDLLYLCHEEAAQKLNFHEAFGIIADRYRQIVRDLDLDLAIDEKLDEAAADISAPGSPPDLAASRGEYLSALVIAKALGYPFIDAAELVFFDRQGQLAASTTYDATAGRLAAVERAVIPGFYGLRPDGQVQTFSRGGSDITGAIVSRAVEASVYENWTDVSGLLMADPRIVDNPRTIETLTYRELRELSYSGATVLHEDAVFPVRAAGIPVHIRNTNEPEAAGTMIVRTDRCTDVVSGAITGIAGRKDFTVITVEKAMMNSEVGYGRRLLNVLEVHGINFEHLPSGIDTMSVVIADRELEGKLDTVLDEIRHECHPDSLDVDAKMALIATVGRGMARAPGTAAKLFSALANAGVNMRMIDQGSSELNIIVGVDVDEYETAVRVIYQAFLDP